MKVDTMRTIDRYAGIPLTFIFSLGMSLLRVFRGKVKSPNLKRTLLIELSEMGSAVLADPAMRKLKSESEAELFFVIFKSNRKSLDILKTIPYDQVFEMRSENLFVLAIDVLKFMVWCRQKRISTIIDLELFSRFTALLAALSGASARIGFAQIHDEGHYRGNIVNFPVRYNPHVHISVNFISLIHTALGYHDTAYPTQPILKESIQIEKAKIEPSQQEIVRKKIQKIYPEYRAQKIFLLNVNASDLLPQRKWLPERFAALTQKFLAQYPDWLVIATGAPGEKEYVAEVVNQINHPQCVNSAGLFLFEELVPLYSLSTMMLTNDSGPAHFASVTDLKIFVIFGPETPALYMPLGNAEAIYLGLPCSPCVSATNHRKTSCITRPCISGIPVEMVYQRMEQWIMGNFSS
ncbi:MAG: glycosyltransferase family 9 protein [Microscillaceae bacterium]|nr:glycosyltransferase family 9 protein [Microscillaceae bacterium]